MGLCKKTIISIIGCWKIVYQIHFTVALRMVCADRIYKYKSKSKQKRILEVFPMRMYAWVSTNDVSLALLTIWIKMFII